MENDWGDFLFGGVQKSSQRSSDEGGCSPAPSAKCPEDIASQSACHPSPHVEIEELVDSIRTFLISGCWTSKDTPQQARSNKGGLLRHCGDAPRLWDTSGDDMTLGLSAYDQRSSLTPLGYPNSLCSLAGACSKKDD